MQYTQNGLAKITCITPIIYIPQSNPSLPLSSTISRKSNNQIMAIPLHSKLSILQFVLLVFISIFSSCLHASDPPLTLDYYASTCPSVFEIVRKEMECEVLSDPRNAALIVRLHFHDCFVQVLISYLVPLTLSLFTSDYI